VQQFDSENVTRVTDVAFHEVKERAHFPHSVLGPYFVRSKNLDGFLPDVKILCSVLDESGIIRAVASVPFVPLGTRRI
jgi:hypothetical protein